LKIASAAGECKLSGGIVLRYLGRHEAPVARNRIGVLPCIFPRQGFVLPRRLSGRSAAWLARLLREQEAGGSNPLAPTILFHIFSVFSFVSLWAILQTAIDLLPEPVENSKRRMPKSLFTVSCQRRTLASR
jgi:hypothetical protein